MSSRRASTRRATEVIIAIQFGLNQTSNACMIKKNQQKEYKEFNVPYETPSNATKSVTIPTTALFDDKGAILSYGLEAELQHLQLDNTSHFFLFCDFYLGSFLFRRNGSRKPYCRERQTNEIN